MKSRKLIILPLLLLCGVLFSQTTLNNIHELALSKLKPQEQKDYIQEKAKQLSGKEKHALLDIALPLAEKEGWTKEAAIWYKWQGIQLYFDGNYPQALTAYQKSLSLGESLKDNALIGGTYNELGIFSMKQKDFKKSESYLTKALEACAAAKDSVCMSNATDNTGLLYMRQEKLEKANIFFLKTLEIRKKIKDSIGLGYVYNNLGAIAGEQGYHEKAINYVKASTEIRKSLRDSFGVAINICNMGEMNAVAGNHQEAVEYFEESLIKAQEVGVVDFTQWVLNQASQSYSQLGNMDKAHSYLKRSYELKDSLLSAEKIAQITEMETKYETEKKEQQIALQQKRMQLGILAFIGFGLLSILGFLYYRSRKIAEQVKEQKLYQEKLLETSLAVQEDERKRIAKDLHDGVGQQLTGLKMAMQQLSGKDDWSTTNEKLIQLTGILDDATNDVRNISHQMMPKALQEFGLAKALEDMIEKSLGNSGLEYDFSAFRAEGRYDEKVEIGFYRVAQELINNILKHSEAKDVSVQLLQNKTHLILTMEDDGKGFDSKQQDSMGHGLMNIQSRVQAMGGTVNFDSELGRGTLVNVRVKVK